MFYDPEKATHRYKHILPHWDQPGTWMFLTWRLGDALPASRLKELRMEKCQWLKQHPKPWDMETEKEYHTTFSRRVDRWLDQGWGSCLLRQKTFRDAVADILLHDDGNRVDVECFVVMPNHVHILFSLQDAYSLAKCLKAWKGISARRINQARNEAGMVWQEGYFDRLIRSQRHWETVRRYILENPQKAGLLDGFFLYEKNG